ncbi:glycoside hydrolase family 2 TIM barrel-domain containing protein [Lacticaseibacillus jixianensis]|uniref:Beta-galactosidase n=1 Tax=Lacticaseibacillus jixianensis TaxID=2486012 RepID=A0ABW4B9M1_9LACO|nr:glycoside hydrolase family 2 TIM barrel-domain containing protein [Lacticaseibacillus jixianensis]
MRKLPPRTRFFAYDELATALTYKEGASPFVHSLNGTWQFCYLQSPREVPAAFRAGDYDAIDWQTIKVPGHMELQGYGKPNYTNISLPIPVDPAAAPANNPTGLYYRRFSCTPQLARQVLRFDGVDSTFTVWLNGQLVGDGHGSRLMTEFDVTDLLKPGENTIAVQVEKWSEYSFLEDQDQWWLSGIFRDVTIIDEGGLNDLQITPQYQEGQWQIAVAVQAEANAHLRGKVYFAGQPVAEAALPTGTTTIPISAPREWTDETPNLYTLVVADDAAGALVPMRFGLRQVEMIDDQICLNGEPVLFNGVNRHEFNPETGRALTQEYILSEVTQIKRAGINAIRTSHYPNTPYFYDVCDELGLLVIDECDLETHGMYVTEMPTDDPYWQGEFVSRAERMVHRDFNHPCIVIWSLGNESDFGENHVAEAAAIRKLDVSRLIHYEGDRKTEVADMYSTMYTPVEDIEKRAVKLTHQKPHILCEYGHAMGNGAGSLQDYQDVFRLYKSVQGGFIWEWKDHGLKQATPAGPQYVWGGAFGEPVNDGTFCIDGLVRPDRVPSPGLLEYEHVIQPFQFFVAQNHVVVKSLYHYQTTRDLVLRWQLEVTGEKVAGGQIALPALAPGALSPVLSLELPEAGGVDAMLNLAIETTTVQGVFETGAQLASQQVAYQGLPAQPDAAATVSQTPAAVTITRGPLTVTVDRGTGNITQLSQDDQKVLAGDMALTLDRLPISNDMNVVAERQKERIATLFARCESIQMTQNDDTVMVAIRQRIAPPAINWGIELAVTLWVGAAGVTIRTRGWFDGEKPTEVPRIGYQLPLTTTVRTVDWFGRGLGESYPDSLDAAPLGHYQLNRDQWGFPYVVPQEAGNRMGVRWATITTATGPSLHVAGLTPFNLNVVGGDGQPLGNQSSDQVRLDARVQALGSNSCGPLPLPRYRLYTDPFDFTVTLNLQY